MLNVLGTLVARTGWFRLLISEVFSLQYGYAFDYHSVWYFSLCSSHLPAIFGFLPVLDDCTSRLPAEKKKKKRKKRKNNRCGESFFYTSTTAGTFSPLIPFFFSVCCCHLTFNFHIQSHTFLFFHLSPPSIALSLLLITPLQCLHAECRHQGHTVIRDTQNLQTHTPTHTCAPTCTHSLARVQGHQHLHSKCLEGLSSSGKVLLFNWFIYVVSWWENCV